ncbi:signal peptidase II . Aspartic peptidase. MEROPS family A08 [Aneurinibacillus migulanus]|uniref:Lipoprotein signal peptidase n=1 Tax=Aneurinibacillus migulanus TaxID=47500 RepID=A0A1G8JSV0_ANEMI|nr:signal peptidase II [Aneurinibacillus migulanus]GED13087.1 lipoprotein signal peptidase [Aneurinibacillus migulanus]SDI34258.1 signal peptidase II . Aspartic peptidase. MEROPS family A08 [Aneurinibacillus migulanus]
MIYYYVIALLVFFADRITKWLVVTYMEFGQSIPLWEGVFHLTSHRNRGAAFGILQNQRGFFIVITIAIIVGIIWYLWKTHRESKLVSLALALILGGAVGNFYDRVLTGEVVDFFDFTLINFPIFNIADSAIVIGVGLFVIDGIRELLMNGRDRKYE